MTYDVVIVGGGPAGSTAGIYLSKQGYKTLIIDKSKFPRDKLCGGALTEKTVKLLEELGIKDYKSVIDYEINTYSVFWKKEELYRGDSIYSFRFVKRKVYDSFLLGKARESGADILEGVKVVNIDFIEKILYLSDGGEVNYRFLIGADGVNSTVRRLLVEKGLLKAENWKKNLANAIEVYIGRDSVGFKIDHPLIILGYIKWGYSWIFPNKDQLVVGIGGLIDKNRDIKVSFFEFLKDFFPDYIPSKIMGHTIPFGNFLREPCYKDVLLIGDAGGITNPASGEGIFSAQKSGILAAESIEKGNPCETYKRFLNETVYREFLRDLKIRNIVYRLESKTLTKLSFKLLHRKLEKIVHL